MSPLLANIYLNEFDQEMKRRGVRVIRYADDIVVFARSKRAAERLLESSRRYLEDKLKLTLGLRYNHDNKSVQARTTLLNFLAPTGLADAMLDNAALKDLLGKKW